MKLNVLHKLLTLVLLTLVSTNLSYAQIDTENLNLDQYLKGGSEDASKLMGSYLNPLFTGFGYASAGGWYNTAKAHKPLGFDLTFTMNFAKAPESEYSYGFNNADYSFVSLDGGATSADLPAIFGDANPSERLRVSRQLNGQDVGTSFDVPPGIDYSSAEGARGYAPLPMIQAGVGLIKNTDLKIRWLPALAEYEKDGFEIGMFGLGLMHDIKQWIPGIKHVPIDISALVAFNSITARINMDFEGGLDGENQVAEMSMNSFTYQLLASKKLSILTLYGGFGFSTVSTTLDVNGTYVIEYDVLDANGDPIQDPTSSDPTDFLQAELTLEDPISEEFDGSGARATVGARLKLAIISLHVDYTIQEYNTITAGLGLTIR